MRSKLRRYEVLLPARFNDGREVPDGLLGEAVKEIVKQFGAVAYFENAAEGYWQQGETLYRDDLGLMVVDIPDTAKNPAGCCGFPRRIAAASSLVRRRCHHGPELFISEE